MPEWLIQLLQVLASNPEALAEIIKLVNRILDLLEKNPDLLKGVSKTLNE